MIGKRKKQFSYPASKKPYGARAASDIVPFAAKNQFGPGYNPKRISYRAPPPNGEVKWFDTSNSISSWVAASADLPSHVAIDSLNRIEGGDKGYNRNGNKIQVTKINLRGTCLLGQNSNETFNSTTPGEVYFRWLLIIDTQCNGSTPAATDIFEQSPVSQDQFSVYNSLTESGRFKVLMDKFIRVNQAHPMFNTETHHTHVGNRLTFFKKTFKVNLPIVYSDNLSNLASVRNNNIFMVIFNGHDGTHCEISYRARIRFTDY